MTLQWATYYDAADQAGISRIWGGIHPPVDNFVGRQAGSQCGKAVWELAKRYFDGSVTDTPLAIQRLDNNRYTVSFDTVRGIYYKLQSTSDLNQAFTNDPPAVAQPYDALTITRTNSFAEPRRFHRAVGSLTP